MYSRTYLNLNVERMLLLLLFYWHLKERFSEEFDLDQLTKILIRFYNKTYILSG